MRLSGLFFIFVGMGTLWAGLWKNLWIACQGMSSQTANCRFACSGSTRLRECNCMETDGLAGIGAGFTSPFRLPVGKYSCFKCFHRSALLQRYKSRFEQ